MKTQRGHEEILNNFDNPIFKLKTISELLFIESANDGKILNADALNGVSLMIADLANEIETLSDELHVKLRT